MTSKERTTGTFWCQWKEETHTYSPVPKSGESVASQQKYSYKNGSGRQGLSDNASSDLFCDLTREFSTGSITPLKACNSTSRISQ